MDGQGVLLEDSYGIFLIIQIISRFLWAFGFRRPVFHARTFFDNRSQENLLGITRAFFVSDSFLLKAV